jgi:hypothetical protein
MGHLREVHYIDFPAMGVIELAVVEESDLPELDPTVSASPKLA